VAQAQLQLLQGRVGVGRAHKPTGSWLQWKPPMRLKLPKFIQTKKARPTRF